MTHIEIKVRENGPYKVTGPVTLIDADGTGSSSPTTAGRWRSAAAGARPPSRSATAPTRGSASQAAERAVSRGGLARARGQALGGGEQLAHVGHPDHPFAGRGARSRASPRHPGPRTPAAGRRSAARWRCGCRPRPPRCPCTRWRSGRAGRARRRSAARGPADPRPACLTAYPAPSSTSQTICRPRTCRSPCAQASSARGPERAGVVISSGANRASILVATDEARCSSEMPIVPFSHWRPTSCMAGAMTSSSTSMGVSALAERGLERLGRVHGIGAQERVAKRLGRPAHACHATSEFSLLTRGARVKRGMGRAPLGEHNPGDGALAHPGGHRRRGPRRAGALAPAPRARHRCVVLEARSRDYVEQRVRAGVLEQDTVDLLHEMGVGERLDREGMVHEGIELRFGGRRPPDRLRRADRRPGDHDLRPAGGGQGPDRRAAGDRRAALRGRRRRVEGSTPTGPA